LSAVRNFCFDNSKYLKETHPMPTSGIYCLLNTCNQKRYIGQSVNLAQRRYFHFSALRHGKHPCAHLQAAFNRYGRQSFQWLILAVSPTINSLDTLERFYIALYRSNDTRHGYNAQPGGLTRPRASYPTLRLMQQAQSRRRARPIPDKRDCPRKP
jgi:group I intron endonuclease